MAKALTKRQVMARVAETAEISKKQAAVEALVALASASCLSVRQRH